MRSFDVNLNFSLEDEQPSKRNVTYCSKALVLEN